MVGDGSRQVGAQGLREGVLRVGAFGGDERVGRQVGQVVEGDGRAALPPGGDLQHRRAADAAVGVEQLVAEAGGAVAVDGDFVADAGECCGRLGEGERDERRAVRVVGDVVLFGDA